MSNGFDPSQNQQEQGGDLRDLMPELPESTIIVERPLSELYPVPDEMEGASPAVRNQQEMLENFAESGYVDAQALLGIQHTPGLDLSGLGMLRSGNWVVPGMERRALQAGYQVGDEFYDIRKYEVLDQLPSEADTGAQTYLALDMFLNVDGAYSRIEEVFNRDGTVNQGTFLDALDQTFKLAYEAGPDMYKTTPLFLDILLGNRDASLEELEALFIERAGSNRSSGRVISYLDPVGLAKAAETAFSKVTGRKATKREQQEFVKVIHGLQSSGQMSIDVGARAEAQARDVSPVEAGAMDHAGAGNLLLQAIGMAR